MHGTTQRLMAAAAAVVMAVATVVAVSVRHPDEALAAPSGASASALPQARMDASMTPSSGRPGSIVRIAGRLTGAGGRPVDGASIAVRGSFSEVPRAFAATDRSGSFTAALQLPTDASAGRVTIWASLVGDTRYRPVSRSWSFTVVGGAAAGSSSATPSPNTAQNEGDSAQNGENSGQNEGDSGQPQSYPRDTIGPAPGPREPPRRPGLLEAFGGRGAVTAFLIVAAALVALALIGWVARAVARLVHRIRHGKGGEDEEDPGDGANDLFD